MSALQTLALSTSSFAISMYVSAIVTGEDLFLLAGLVPTVAVFCMCVVEKIGKANGGRR